jgi:hypothetical protein
MKICPMCQATDHVFRAEFCYADGTSLQEAPTCSCGQFLGKYDKFCPICGKPALTDREKQADYDDNSGHSATEDVEAVEE